jgi:hypothetical protein
MGMLLGQLYQMCAYLVQVILQCFYKNMHLPIVSDGSQREIESDCNFMDDDPAIGNGN